MPGPDIAIMVGYRMVGYVFFMRINPKHSVCRMHHDLHWQHYIQKLTFRTTMVSVYVTGTRDCVLGTGAECISIS